MRQWFQRLKSKLGIWLLGKAVVLAYPYLAAEATKIGEAINAGMDRKMGQQQSDLVQKQLIAPALEAVAKALRA